MGIEPTDNGATTRRLNHLATLAFDINNYKIYFLI